MKPIDSAAVYIAANLVILLILAVRVVAYRSKHRVIIGDGGHEALERRIRAHGNATEYVPALLVGLVALAVMNAPIWAIHSLGVLFTVGRILHGIGMSGGILPPRQFGVVLTWLSYVLLAGILFGLAVT